MAVVVFCCSVVSDSFATPWTIAPPGSSVHEISQARILEWVPFPSPGIEPTSPELVGGFFTTEPSGKPVFYSTTTLIFLKQNFDNPKLFSGSLFHLI